MDVDPPNGLQPQPYTIVRIKRKRNEEPLDALVVDAAPSRKRSRGGLNVFQYAGTVEETAWNDEQQKKRLERHLANLADVLSHKEVEKLSTSAPPVSNAAASTTASPAKPPQAHSRKRPMYHSPSRTYTILPQDKVLEDPYVKQRQAKVPPKVWSTKEYEAMKRATQFKMYEAVPSTPGKKSPPVPDETDAEIEKFLPLLKDYLSLNEIAPEPLVNTPTSSMKNVDGDDGVEDYVYDVFYRRPATIMELYDPSSSANIAKLTGLPPELSGLSGEDDSDDDHDDEDDEDSNAEDWYTNDYPDEDESDRESEDLSDEFHEHVVRGNGRDMSTYRDVMLDM